MKKRKNYRKPLVIVTCLFLAVVTIGVLFENRKPKEEDAEEIHIAAPFLFRRMIYEMQPFYAFLAGDTVPASPMFLYSTDHAGVEDIKEYYLALMEVRSDDEAVVYSDVIPGVDGGTDISGFIKGLLVNKTEASEEGQEVKKKDNSLMMFPDTDYFFEAGSGFVSRIEAPLYCGFQQAEVKSNVFTHEELRDFSFVMERFYTVDASTAPVSLTDLDALLDVDCTVDRTREGPHILIYHTHSQEGFADSVPGDKSTSIMGAGEYLAELLRGRYGYSVYHHTGTYDVDNRDDAYAVAAPAIEEILEEYPQIQVIIDLHRDGVAENRHLMKEVQGIPMAQFMFFNGVSYSNKKGELTYLPNVNLEANLALSLKLGIAANEYYPGLARTNYLNAYRYNMHYRDKSILIELGAQTNTVEEVMNACEPLAHILDVVLSGKEKYQ